MRFFKSGELWAWDGGEVFGGKLLLGRVMVMVRGRRNGELEVGLSITEYQYDPIGCHAQTRRDTQIIGNAFLKRMDGLHLNAQIVF